MKPGQNGAQKNNRSDGVKKLSAATRQHAGNHFSHKSAHERQAEQVANRYFRGEAALSRGLTPAPHAGFSLPSSRSDVLPNVLKNNFENAFHADFSAVRLHLDTRAQQAAYELGARAFTAGAHIYFAVGQFQPDSLDGQALIAHELAHTLQQVGRASQNGQLAVMNGAANYGIYESNVEVQRAPDFTSLRKLHAEKGESGDYKSVADAINLIADKKSDLEKYATDHWADIASWTAQAESLLYDALKNNGSYEMAAKLIERNNFEGGKRIRTVFGIQSMVDILDKRSTGQYVFYRAIKTIPVLKLYYSEWARLVEMFLLAPIVDKTPPLLRNLDPASGGNSKKWQDIKDLYNGIVKAYSDQNGAVENEWFYEGIAKIYSIDVKRREACDQARATAKKKYPNNLFLQRKSLGAEISSWAKQLRRSYVAKTSSTDPDVELSEKWKPFFQESADILDKSVARVGEIWASEENYSQALSKLLVSDEKKPTLSKENQQIRDLVKQLALSSGLATVLIQMLSALNASDSKKNRIPADYFERCTDQAKMIQRILRMNYENRVLWLFRTGKTSEVVASLWTIFAIHWMLRPLRWEVAPFGNALKPGSVTVVIDDAEHVQAHRLEMADRVQILGAQIDLQSLRTAGKSIFNAELEDESLLVLLPNDAGNVWQEDSVTAEKIVKDFNNVPIKGDEPLTAFEYLLVNRIQFFETLRNKLKHFLPTDEAGEQTAVNTGNLGDNILAKNYNDTNEDFKAKGKKPQRWFVENANGMRAYFAAKKGKKTFAQLLQERLNKEVFYQQATAAGMQSVWPMEFKGRVFVWLWPSYDKMTPLLRDIGALNEIVAQDKFKKIDKESLYKTQVELSDADWLASMRSVMNVKFDTSKTNTQQFSEQELKDFLAKIEAFFKKRYQDEKNSLTPFYHKALRIDRQRMASRIRNGLAEYKQDRHRTHIAVNMGEDAQKFYLLTLSVFDEDVQTSVDKVTEVQQIIIDPASRPRLHLAALMLEIAGSMETAFEYEDVGKVVYTWLGLTQDAMQSAAALKAMSPAARATYLPSQENNDAWLTSSFNSLDNVRNIFVEVRERVQAREGFTAKFNDNTLSIDLSYSSPMPAGTIVLPRAGTGILGADPTGKRYRFLKVLKDFIYHPEFGDYRPLTKRTAATGYNPAQFLTLDGKPLTLSPGEKLLHFEELDKDDNPIRDLMIGAESADDLALLQDIYNGSLYWAFGSAMENANAFIAQYLDTLVDLAELIPGWGKIITGAKVVVAIAEFWSSDIYQDMLKIIHGDVTEMIHGLYDRVVENANTDALINLLLFGNPVLDNIISIASDLPIFKSDKLAASRPPETQGKFGALKKIFAAVKKLGKAFVHALDKVHQKVQQPMQDAQEYVSTRPVLSFAMSFAANHIYDVMQLAVKSAALLGMFNSDDEKEAKKDNTDLMDSLRNVLGAEQKDIGAKIHHMLVQVEELHLPKKIVNIAPAIQFVLDQLVVFVGKRLGLEGKFVTIIINRSGLLDLFTSRVAQAIVDKGADPNIYWRETVVPMIADKFEDTKKSLIEGINSLLAEPAFDGMFTTIDTGPKLDLSAKSDENYSELMDDGAPQPSTENPKKLTKNPSQIPAMGTGSPINPALKNILERQFGQDFSHVRLHIGEEGNSMAGAFGAAALTAGSHIFMPDAVSSATQGKDILHHELAHVVQQSGSRPLGGSHSAAPIAARPELGLNVNPRSEQEADAIAKQVGSQHTSGGANTLANYSNIELVGKMQPFDLKDLNPYTLAKILRGFNRLPAIKEDEVALDKTKGLAKLSRNEDASAIDAFLTALQNVAKKSSKTTLESPKVFSSVVDKVLHELDKKLDPDHFKKVAYKIAEESQDDIPQPKVGKGGPAPKQEKYVNSGHFTRKIEGYILGKTGVALAIALNHTSFNAPAGKSLEQINKSDPIKKLNLLHVYLPYIAPNADLSIMAITNTWPAAKTDDKLRSQLSSLVRTTMEAYGIRATVWALFGSEYKFSYFFKHDIDEMLRQSQIGALSPADLPPPSVYVKTDFSDKKNRVGVRLATHKDLTDNSTTGRHSHHLTQFLIADYFANTNDKQPFKPKRKYPGILTSKNSVTHISSNPNIQSEADAKTDDSISVAKTRGDDSDRGGAMPAISLAAATHMGGELHITPGPDDLGKAATKTQGFAVDSTFRSKLPAELKADASDASYNAYVKKNTEAGVAKQLYSAAQDTFRHWAGHMNTQLKANMPRLELQYYKTLAVDSPDATIKDMATNTTEQNEMLDLLIKVSSDAVAHNYSVMSALGWQK